MPRVWKDFDISYFNEVGNERPDSVEGEIKKQRPHYQEEKAGSVLSPKLALLEVLEERYSVTRDLYKQTEVSEKNSLYYIEGIAYLKGFDDMIENYLSIRNSSQHELDITDYSMLDIDEKIIVLESKKMNNIISSEDRMKVKEISDNIQNRIYKITADDLIFIKSIMTKFLVEFVEDIL